MTRRLGGWILAGTIALGSVMAHAVPDTKGPYPTCSTSPSESDRKAAQGAFAAGQGSFNEADYQTAVMYWRDAYRRDCTAHALLLNLARAYELKSERAEAIAALEAYLQRKPDDPAAEQIQRRIQNLRAQAGTQPSASASASSSGSVLPSASWSTPPPPPPPTVVTTSHVNVPPLIVAGVGLVVTVGGIGALAAGITKVSDAEKTCPTHNQCPDPTVRAKGNEGRDQQAFGAVLITLGAAAVGTGAIWYLLTPKKTTTTTVEPTVSLRPALGPNMAGFSLGGSF